MIFSNGRQAIARIRVALLGLCGVFGLLLGAIIAGPVQAGYSKSNGTTAPLTDLLLLTAAEAGQFNDFANPANSTGITIGGNPITADISASLSFMGFALGQYTDNFWPRRGPRPAISLRRSPGLG